MSAPQSNAMVDGIDQTDPSPAGAIADVDWVDYSNLNRTKPPKTVDHVDNFIASRRLLTRGGVVARESRGTRRPRRRTSGRFGGPDLYWHVPWQRSPVRIRLRRSARPCASGSRR